MQRPVEQCQLEKNPSMLGVEKLVAFLFPPRRTAGKLRLSGLFLRRKSDQEFHSYIPLFDYNPWDYEVLLRVWGSAPFSQHLSAFSGPIIAGENPEETLLNKSNDWTKDLASERVDKLAKSTTAI